MATYTSAKSVHKTLTGTVADSVNITGYERVTIIERGNVAPLFISWDGTMSPPTAVALADGTEYVGPGGFLEVDAAGFVSIVGAGNPYSVIGVSP